VVAVHVYRGTTARVGVADGVGGEERNAQSKLKENLEGIVGYLEAVELS
jgi:hypothetical protein